MIYCFLMPMLVQQRKITDCPLCSTENLQKQAVSKEFEDDTEVASESAEHHAEVYNKVQEFLEHYESLAASVGKLKGIDSDFKSKESSLTQSIKQVKELWKVENTDS